MRFAIDDRSVDVFLCLLVRILDAVRSRVPIAGDRTIAPIETDDYADVRIQRPRNAATEKQNRTYKDSNVNIGETVLHRSS